MKLKKMTPELASGIIDAGFDKAPRAIQNNSFPKIKSGADLYIIAPVGAGKSTAIVMGVIQQLKMAFEEAPRAIIMTASKEKAFAMEEQFQVLGRHTDLRTFTVFDQGILQYQKDMIYEGLDVLIGTPKRLNELISITGIPMTNLKMLVVDDAEMLSPNLHHPVIYRIADGMEKAQFLIFANIWSDKFHKISERMMKNPIVVSSD